MANTEQKGARRLRIHLPDLSRGPRPIPSELKPLLGIQPGRAMYFADTVRTHNTPTAFEAHARRESRPVTTEFLLSLIEGGTTSRAQMSYGISPQEIPSLREIVLATDGSVLDGSYGTNASLSFRYGGLRVTINRQTTETTSREAADRGAYPTYSNTFEGSWVTEKHPERKPKKMRPEDAGALFNVVEPVAALRRDFPSVPEAVVGQTVT